MEVEVLKSLSDLEQRVSELDALVERRKGERKNFRPILFRGHADAEWKLQTTLERFGFGEFRLAEYNNVLGKIHSSVKSLSSEKMIEDIDTYEDSHLLSVPPSYEFMARTRHHGFPSPLLDWTSSLYVVLYFAFFGVDRSESVALFVFIDSIRGGKGFANGVPHIIELGPTINTHKRHYQQQSRYTVAVNQNENGLWSYCPHSSVLYDVDNGQDILYILILPSEIKEEVLWKLNQMNINDFTLFGSEESLMNVLAYNELSNSTVYREE